MAAPWAELPPGRFAFRTIGSDQGLGNLAIEAVAQDTSGFLWVGTQDGLYRYDGRQFTRFGVEDGLPGNWITTVLAGPGDQLWIGTRNGLGWRDGRRFASVALATKLSRTSISGLALDGRGRLWIATPNGLFRRDLDASFHAAVAWPPGPVNAVFADPADSDAVYASQGQRVGRIDVQGFWTFWDTGIDQGETVEALAVDGGGTLWVSTPHHLLWKGPEDPAFHDEPANPGSRFSISSRRMLALDGDGNLWVPTASGLFQRRDRGWRHLGASAGLPGASVEGLFFDREGSLWVWQAGLGLHRQLGGGLWESWTDAEGLPSSLVWSVHRDRAGTLWVGTDDGLVRAADNLWRTVAGTEGLAIRRIAEAADGTLWLGAAPTQVIHLQPATGSLTVFDREQGVVGDRVLDVLADRHGGAWIATLDAGLQHLAAGAARFERIETPFDSPALMVAAVAEDQLGRIWIAGNRSLAVREAGSWRVLPAPERVPDDNGVYFALAPPGNIWVAYGRPLGADLLSVDPGAQRVLEHRAPVASATATASTAYSLGLDRLGRIWMGTGRGVDVLAADGADHFDTSDGLVNDDCSHLAFWSDPNGDVFFGTSGGLSRLQGARYSGPPAPPSTKILEATVGGTILSELASPASFPRQQNRFDARFTSLSFGHGSNVEYQARLVGLEDEWQPVHLGETHYPALRAGRYRFEARARSAGGAWGQTSAIRFTILPAWWESWPARALLVALVLGLIFGAVKIRERQQQQHRRELEALIETRTAQLSAANAQLERLATTDGLTGIANRRAFDQCLELELRRAHRAGGGTALLLIDVDHFKAYNDTYGHAAGDDCLRRVAQALSLTASRASDLVARYGGEEFAILLPATDAGGAQALAERVRAAVETLAIPHLGADAQQVTISVGAGSLVALDGGGAADLMRWADGALYRAKVAGRNRTAAHEPASPIPEYELAIS